MSADEAPETQPASFMTAEGEDEGNATEQQRAPGDALAGSPGSENDECTQQYNAERHRFNGRGASPDEQVPSAGWREVYYSMRVQQR